MRDRERGVISEIPEGSDRRDEMIAQCFKGSLIIGRMTRSLEKHSRQAVLVVLEIEGDQNREVVAERSAISSEYPTDFLVDDLSQHLPCDLSHHIDNTVTTRIIPVILNNFQTC